MNDQPTPTEKSQIVIAYSVSQPALVMRFSSVKKGEKEYARLCKAWHARTLPYDAKKKSVGTPPLCNVDGDMFIAVVDLDSVASIAFVDHAKRAKFVPL